MRAALVALVTLSPALASARPITIGATVGEAQSEAEGANNQGPDLTYGLFVRVGITRHIAGQLEVTRINSDSDYDTRSASLLGVIDLSSGWGGARLAGRLVPLVLLGGGEAWGSSALTTTDSYALHLEAGLGLEYRARGGLVIGIDARIGNRWMQTSTATFNPGCACGCCFGPGPGPQEDEGLWDGQYRSLRTYVGLTF